MIKFVNDLYSVISFLVTLVTVTNKTEQHDLHMKYC
jgi:hypothetical protein